MAAESNEVVLMRTGQLRHKITIQQAAKTSDGFGGWTQTWTNFATVWAAIEPLRGREFFAAAQVQAEQITRIRIRYLAGITPKMRILFDARTFSINTIINVNERNRELHLMCEEMVS